jgi:hypothetical protein
MTTQLILFKVSVKEVGMKWKQIKKQFNLHSRINRISQIIIMKIS